MKTPRKEELKEQRKAADEARKKQDAAHAATIAAIRKRDAMPYVCKYDKNDPEGKSFALSDKAIAAIRTLGSELCRQQGEAEPDFADCWQAFAWSIDDCFQLHMRFGGDAEDVIEYEDDQADGELRLVELKREARA